MGMAATALSHCPLFLEGPLLDVHNPDHIYPCFTCRALHLGRIRRTADGLDGPPRQSERPPPGRPTDGRDRQATDGK
jgi:hypothetical protein